MATPPPPPPSSGAPFPPLAAIEGYQPSGKIGPLALPLALICLLVLPFFAAFIYQKTAHFGLGLFNSMWFLVGAALLLGIVVGLGFFPAVQWGKIRNPTLIAAVALLAGIATFAFALYLEADAHRAEVAPSALNSPVALTQSYLAGRADVGTTVSGRGGRGANISGTMFWALLGIEGLLCAIGAAVAANVLALRRYSEEFGRWMSSKTIFNFPSAAAPELVALANASDWPNFATRARALKSATSGDNVSSATVHLVLEKPGGVLQIRAVTDPKVPIATVYEKHLTPTELNAISAEFPAPAGESGRRVDVRKE